MFSEKPRYLHPKLFEVITAPDIHIGLILGGIRRGKSLLGYGAMDDLHTVAAKDVYVFGLPPSKSKLLPSFMKTVGSLDDVPDGSALLVDEAYREFYSRMSMSHRNKFIDTLAALSGQKGLASIYITQHARRLERGIVSSVDYILFKKPSLMQIEFDRPELKPTLAKVRNAFQELKPPENVGLKEYEKMCTYVMSEEFIGMVENSNSKPDWWTEDLSKAYAGVPLEEKRKGEAMTEKEIIRLISEYMGGKKRK